MVCRGGLSNTAGRHREIKLFWHRKNSGRLFRDRRPSRQRFIRWAGFLSAQRVPPENVVLHVVFQMAGLDHREETLGENAPCVGAEGSWPAGAGRASV